MFAKFFSMYFLLGSMLPGTNFSDLVRIPDMVDHYQLHVQEAAALCEEYSILQFINDHFINPDEHTQSGHEQEHQNLPLQSVSSNLLVTIEFELPTVGILHAEKNVHFTYVLAEAPGCEKSIFQPPI